MEYEIVFLGEEGKRWGGGAEGCEEHLHTQFILV